MVNLDQLLVQTSRTFALAIPLLPAEQRQDVTLSYLLFRVADTLEDATRWGREGRLTALSELAALLREPDQTRAGHLAAQWTADPPCEHAGYLDLITELPALLEAMSALPSSRREIILEHTLRTTMGMSSFLERSDEHGNLLLASEEDLRHYCYVVAGIVGEMLTSLFLHAAPGLSLVAATLRAGAPAFGEALQLVNIQRDAAEDARVGRFYVSDRIELGRVAKILEEDLKVAERYVRALQEAQAPRGFVAFTALPLMLARATIDRVRQEGPGAKLKRRDVADIMDRLNSDLDSAMTCSSVSDVG